MESLAARIESYAARHGEGFYAAVRRVGPSAFRLVEEAGEHSPQAIRVLSRFGEDGAVWVVSRPRAMKLLLEHGEEAAAVLAKTRGVAEPAVAALGKPAVKAFESLASGQSARRLAMMAADGGELAATGRAPRFLASLASMATRRWILCGDIREFWHREWRLPPSSPTRPRISPREGDHTGRRGKHRQAVGRSAGDGGAGSGWRGCPKHQLDGGLQHRGGGPGRPGRVALVAQIAGWPSLVSRRVSRER